MKILMIYLCIINALAFVLMHADKRKSRRGAWRIRERTLLGIAALGGSLGATAAMYLFRHKTRHTRFRVGLPLLSILHLSALFALFLLKNKRT